MSSHTAQQRPHRDDSSPAPVEAPQASRTRQAISAAVFILLACGVVVTAIKLAGRDEAENEGPFGQHYAGLEERRQAAGVPTMAEANPSVHLHPRLAVYANGRRIRVPPSIGIAPDRPGAQMAALHTHDASGKLHVEGAESATLGQFFRIWGVPFSESQLGPHRADGDHAVHMWVDGRPSRAFDTLKLADDLRITVSFGRRDEIQPPG